MIEEISWDARLIGIKGARGVGKTTLMLQYIKKYLKTDHTVLYVSLDQIWFSENRLTDLADFFVKQGGKQGGKHFFWMKYTSIRIGLES